MNKLTKFLSAVTLQTIILFLLILFKYLILSGGTEVYLKIEQKDPTDPMRGDYLTFDYNELSELEPYMFSYTNEAPVEGDIVYVYLKEWRVNWVPESATLKKPEDGSQLYIKGKVVGVQKSFELFNYGENNLKNDRDRVEKYLVKYGIEEFYIPEGTGNNYNFAGDTMYAKVVIDDDGNSVLKNIEARDDIMY